MKLFWGPHTCAIGIHALLEEAGALYELEKVDVQGGKTHEEPFKSINPKGKVPVLLRDDGTRLTEFGTIAHWIARSYPDANLMPGDKEHEAQATELMDYAVGTLHGQAFTRVFFPQRYMKDPAHKDAVKADGKAMLNEGFAIQSALLGDHPYAAGRAFTIADAALFYTARWAKMLKLDLPTNIAAHFERINRRPAFQAAIEQEAA